MKPIEINGLDKAYDLLINQIPKQTAFATSRTINRCLKAAQDFTTQTLLPKNQKLRSKWFLPGRKFGYNSRFSNKTNLEGRMGTAAEWEGLQEQGGLKKPKNQFLSVPINARPSPSDVIPRRLRAKALKAAGRSFVITSKIGQKLLIRRDNRTRTTVMYVFKPEAKVKPVLNFDKENTRLVDDLFPRIFDDEFIKAMATAK
jgi:hypothetical protein